MGEVRDLLVAIGSFVGSLASAFVLVWTTVVKPHRDAKQAAKKAAKTTAEKLLAAVADGEITPEEVNDIRNSLEEEQ
ncbi:hypothetical protein [Prauserella endophytica]|uniref:SHOCT domain-containing protein n=1 Tax=Prauserella endophytica TaxID=1592324 RepID=A0ABY2RTQ7_9PSEU|nr:hypothetical protein [Prauserella endophytica]TKG58906.1 hypothetical protein FCN18_37470 [Prauserella endophytica]